MEQHRDAPGHIRFNCNMCGKSFESKQAVSDHQKSPKHKSKLSRAELARRASPGIVTTAENVRLLYERILVE
jgi:hypothetical protein